MRPGFCFCQMRSMAACAGRTLRKKSERIFQRGDDFLRDRLAESLAAGLGHSGKSQAQKYRHKQERSFRGNNASR